jgi:hypothetical protein
LLTVSCKWEQNQFIKCGGLNKVGDRQTDNVQTSAKERMKIKVFRVVMLCLWVSFLEFLKTLDVESSASFRCQNH